MSWKPAVIDPELDLAKYEGEGEDEVQLNDITFGLEEIDGAYDFVDGKIVMLDKPLEPAARKKKKQVAAVEEDDDTDAPPLSKKEAKKEALKAKKKEELKAQRKARIAELKAEKAAAKQEVQEEEEEEPQQQQEAIEEEEAADLPEWQAFGLHPLLMKGIEAMGFKYPSPIQKLCIPAVLNKGKDVLGVSETGSGKTLAYGLPILSRLLQTSSSSTAPDGVQCLVVTPTRELAMQVTEHFRNALQCVPLADRPRVESIVGGISEDKQERLLNRLPAIVVATMGRLKAFLVDRPHAHLKNMKQSLRFLVLDEADRLSDPMHAHDLQPLLDMLVDVSKKATSAKQRQTLLFSATLLNTEESMVIGKKPTTSTQGNKAPISGPLVLMEKLGRRGKAEVCEVVKDNSVIAAAATDSKAAVEPKQKAATTATGTITLPDTIDFSLVECTDEDKEAFLHYVIASKPQSHSILVFVNTINATHRLGATLQLNFPEMVIGSLHANMDQSQRLRNLDRFKKVEGAEKRLMVCSDVAARGLDIPSVDLVIHYGMPSRVDTFVHRSGRCGRAGKLGSVVCMSSGLEVQRTGKIRNAIAPRKMAAFIPDKDGDGDTVVVPMKQIFKRFNVCKKLQALLSQQKGKNIDDNWRKRTAQEADLVLSEDEDENKRGDTEEKQNAKAKLNRDVAKLQNELSMLLSGQRTTIAGQHRRGRKRMQI